MRLAWFTPLPPMGSGIADYSFELLPYVSERADVQAVCPRPGRLRRPRAPGGIEVISPEAFRRQPGEYDAVIYHLGNNPHHEFVYEASLQRPGVVVFHDFILHHLIAHMTVESHRDRPRYGEIFRGEYGELGDRAARLRYRGVATEFEKFLFPMNAHVARQARAIVVHSEDSRDRMMEIAPEVPVTVIPHHAGDPPPSVAGVTRESARRDLGLPRDAFLVGHFGYITRPKQPAAVVKGFARLAARQPDAMLLMVGADNTGGGLQRMIRNHGLQDRVRLVGFVDLDRFYRYLRAIDASINLRYPSAGESSGTFARALAEGRPAIVNNAGSFAEIPQDVALHVEIDGDQAEEVGEHLISLAEDPAFRAHVEARAKAYAETVLDPHRCADLYVRAASQVASFPKEDRYGGARSSSNTDPSPRLNTGRPPLSSRVKWRG